MGDQDAHDPGQGARLAGRLEETTGRLNLRRLGHQGTGTILAECGNDPPQPGLVIRGQVAEGGLVLCVC